MSKRSVAGGTGATLGAAGMGFAVGGPVGAGVGAGASLLYQGLSGTGYFAPDTEDPSYYQ
jgi:hypothetical protein